MTPRQAIVSGIVMLASLAATRSVCAMDLEAELHEACQNGDGELVVSRLAAGAKPNTKDSNGWAPLHHAVTSNSLATVQALLACDGIQIDIGDEFDGYTPLYLAVAGGHAEIVQALLAAGANPRAASKDGVSPLDISLPDTGIEVLLQGNKTGNFKRKRERE